MKNKQKDCCINKRRSVRKFTDEPITEEELHFILNSAMVAPSGMGIKPWDLIVIKDKETLKDLSQVGSWKGFIADSAVSIVITADPAKSEFWLQDVSMVAENMQLAAVEQKLGSCWGNIMWKQEDQQGQEERCRELLGIPSDLRVVCAIAIGHPAEEVSPYDDSVFDESKIHIEKW